MNQQEFYNLGKEVIDYFMEIWPVAGTHMGVHDRDSELSDLSERALAEAQDKFLDYRQELEKGELQDFTDEAEIDHQLLHHNLKAIIREHEVIKSHRRNPNLYVEEVFGGVMSLIMKDFAPLEERLTSLLGRLKQIPGVFQQARENLDQEDIPPIWIEVSQAQLKMAPGLFTGLLPGMAAEHLPAQAEAFKEAGQQAAAATEEFLSFLKNEAGFKAKGDFAVGEEIFNTLLEENHMVDYDAAELLEIGREIFAETKSRMEQLSREIDPQSSVEELMEKAKADHPEAEKLLDVYRQTMAETREFVITNQIASLPEEERLTIIETPEYLRPIVPYAAYMPPGIFAEELEGLFLVTPVDPEADEEEKLEKLKGHYHAKLPITTLHEGYPGHHLQLSWSAVSGSNIRKTGSFLSTLFVEGWAFYCEELMEDLGYIDAPIQKLGRLSDQLWRAARIILDVKLHCQGMEADDAIDFLVDKCQLERSNALAEVRRYTGSPTQPQSYLMGKREILKIIDSYQKKFPGKSTREMHDEILQAGSLPPKLMRKHLGL